MLAACVIFWQSTRIRSCYYDEAFDVYASDSEEVLSISSTGGKLK